MVIFFLKKKNYYQTKCQNMYLKNSNCIANQDGVDIVTRTLDSAILISSIEGISE